MYSVSFGRRICALDVLRSPLIDALALLDRDICDIAGRTIKQNVDLFEGETFGLWQAEVNKWYRERDAAREHEICSVTVVI